MYRVALRIVGSADAAHDVVQEACLKVLHRAAQFEGRASLVTWLHRITVNCAFDHMRRHRQQKRGRADWDPGRMAAVAVAEAGPAECAEQTEMYRLALELVAKLPDDCRSAFILTQLDGYTYDEAAAIEDLCRGTVASRVYRARQILVEQMNHHLAGEVS
jgi:RNA polymerase sigma-70 factor (ECF subfamily)